MIIPILRSIYFIFDNFGQKFNYHNINNQLKIL